MIGEGQGAWVGFEADLRPVPCADNQWAARAEPSSPQAPAGLARPSPDASTNPMETSPFSRPCDVCLGVIALLRPVSQATSQAGI